MNQKSKIVALYKKKIQLLKKHNKLYFNDDSPVISDAKYDNLKKEILNLEIKNDFLKKLNLGKKIIGSLLLINLKK